MEFIIRMFIYDQNQLNVVKSAKIIATKIAMTIAVALRK